MDQTEPPSQPTDCVQENEVSSSQGEEPPCEIFDLSELAPPPSSDSHGSPLIPMEPDANEGFGGVRLGKALRGQWYAYLESFKTFPTKLNAACRELDTLDILRDTEVRIAQDEVVLCMTLTVDGDHAGEEPASDKEACLQDCVQAVLHR